MYAVCIYINIYSLSIYIIIIYIYILYFLFHSSHQYISITLVFSLVISPLYSSFSLSLTLASLYSLYIYIIYICILYSLLQSLPHSSQSLFSIYLYNIYLYLIFPLFTLVNNIFTLVFLSCNISLVLSRSLLHSL